MITYSAQKHILAGIIERGPICVDGVSLTVIARSKQTFSVSIVVFTGAHTTLLERAVGDPVNLESDIMMRYITRAVELHQQRANTPDYERSALARTRDPLLAPDASLLELVEAVRALPFGRSHDRSIEGLLRERRGTCTTKHLFLACALAERFPQTNPQIVHRVYRAQRELIRDLHGDSVAELIPENGLIDVHRYLLIQVEGRQITLDATFPAAEPWDGSSSLPVACGPGDDIPAGDDPDADKRALEARYCDPIVREPFIAALSTARKAQC